MNTENFKNLSFEEALNQLSLYIQWHVAGSAEFEMDGLLDILKNQYNDLANQKSNAKTIKTDNIDTDIWINKGYSCPNGVLGVDWCANDAGFGRWELVLDNNKIPHIYSESMDNNGSKEFSKMILQTILDKAIIED